MCIFVTVDNSFSYESSPKNIKIMLEGKQHVVDIDLTSKIRFRRESEQWPEATIRCRLTWITIVLFWRLSMETTCCFCLKDYLSLEWPFKSPGTAYTPADQPDDLVAPVDWQDEGAPAVALWTFVLFHSLLKIIVKLFHSAIETKPGRIGCNYCYLKIKVSWNTANFPISWKPKHTYLTTVLSALFIAGAQKVLWVDFLLSEVDGKWQWRRMSH
jgi:hypothetical protein